MLSLRRVRLRPQSAIRPTASADEPEPDLFLNLYLNLCLI
jgi:hypothetical protein